MLVRGDHEANENKIRRATGAQKIALADPDTIQKVTGAPVGFAGPVGMAQKIPIYADYDVRVMRNAVTGANAAETHTTGVNPGRDFEPDKYADLRNAKAAIRPRCGGKLATAPRDRSGPRVQARDQVFRPSPPDSSTPRNSCTRSSWAATESASRIIAGMVGRTTTPRGSSGPMPIAPTRCSWCR